MKCPQCGETFMFPSYRPRVKVISVPKKSPSDSGVFHGHDIGWFDACCPHCGRRLGESAEGS